MHTGTLPLPSVPRLERGEHAGHGVLERLLGADLEVGRLGCLVGLPDAGVVALVSLVSPFRADRAAARAVSEARELPFLEVWISTPLEECERRDPKGLYARARAGEIPDLTGIGQPYEAPEAPDLEIGPEEPLEDAVARVLAAL